VTLPISKAVAAAARPSSWNDAIVCTGDGASEGERGDRGSDPGHGVVGDWRDGVSTGARAAAGEGEVERDRGATVERAVVEPIAPGGGSRLSTVGEGIS